MCAQREFRGCAKLEEQGSAVKHTCIFDSDFDYHLVTPKVKSVTRDEMELFGIALEALPESDEYAVKVNPVITVALKVYYLDRNWDIYKDLGDPRSRSDVMLILQ